MTTVKIEPWPSGWVWYLGPTQHTSPQDDFRCSGTWYGGGNKRGHREVARYAGTLQDAFDGARADAIEIHHRDRLEAQ